METQTDPRLESFERLLNIMDELRSGCPWDKKQTYESLRYLTIEETYELSDAILKGDENEIKKELGDLMLHLVFYSKIGSEKGSFDISDVLNGICEKLIHRHPHIYANVNVADDEEVKSNWEKIKLNEKGGNTSVLSGVPKSLPAMVKACRIQEKARGVGFDWKNSNQVFEKVEEELREFKHELAENNTKKIEEEFGDLLFALVNFSRFIHINPEDALERTNLKFIKRFSHIEKMAKENNRSIEELSLEEMDHYWNECKQISNETTV
jgi:XTP/dITP diphosphohydrolase